MKITHRTNPVLVENDNDVKQFGMIVDAKSFSIIVDGIYSDTIKAIVREYGCNAIDSHKKAKNYSPFDIHMPTYSQPVFYVRDYGVGLDEEDIVNVFTVAFKSTKEDSNLFTGQLGIGAMCGFAYNTKSFTVTSWKDGIEYIYACFLNEDGCPAYTKISEKKSTEPTGVKIELPVAKKDMNNFRVDGKKIISCFEIQPSLFGGLQKGDVTTILHDSKTHFKFNNWAYSSNSNIEGAHVLMGSVLYKIPSDNKLAKFSNLLNHNIIILANIGDIDFTVSREQAKLTIRTVEFIKDAFKQVENDLVKLFDDISSEKNEYGAIQKCLNILNNMTREQRNIIHSLCILNEVKFHSNRIQSCMNSFTDSINKSVRRDDIRVLVSANTMRGIRCDKSFNGLNRCINIQLYLEDKKGYRNIIGNSVKSDNDKFKVAIIFNSKLYTKESIVALLNCDESDIILTSSITKPSINRSTIGKSGDISKLNIYAKRASDKFINIENAFNDKTTYYYVERCGYSYKYKDMVDNITNLSIVFKYMNTEHGCLDIYAVKTKAIKNLGKNWINIIDFVTEKINKEEVIKLLANKNVLDSLWSKASYSYDDNLYEFISKNRMELPSDHRIIQWFDSMKALYVDHKAVKSSQALNFQTQIMKKYAGIDENHNSVKKIYNMIMKQYTDSIKSLEYAADYPIIIEALANNRKYKNDKLKSQIIKFLTIA